MINFRLFLLAFSTVTLYLMVPPSPPSLKEDLLRCLSYCTKHPKEIQELAKYSLKISKTSNVYPELLLSTMIIESYKRPSSLRKLEKAFLKLSLIARNAGIKWVPDLSLGKPQMKLSTAFWIKSDFQESLKPLIKYSTDQIYSTFHELNEIETSIWYVERYFNFIMTKEMEAGLSPQEELTSTILKQTKLARLASKYRGGIPFSSKKITTYGRLVNLLCNSRFVKNCIINSSINS